MKSAEGRHVLLQAAWKLNDDERREYEVGSDSEIQKERQRTDLQLVQEHHERDPQLVQQKRTYSWCKSGPKVGTKELQAGGGEDQFAVHQQGYQHPYPDAEGDPSGANESESPQRFHSCSTSTG